MTVQQRLAALGLMALVGSPTPAGDADEANIGVPSVTVESAEHATIVRAELPGRLVAYTFARAAGGSRRVVLLSDPAAGPAPDPGGTDEQDRDEPRPMPPCPDALENRPEPKVIHAFDVARPTDVLKIGEAPPTAGDVESVDLDGDGTDEILVTVPGRKLLLGTDGQLTTLFEDDALRGGYLHPEAAYHPSVAGLPWFTLAGWGTIALVGPGEDGTWKPLARADLPIEGRAVEPSVLVAFTRTPRLVGRSSDGAWVLATPPEQAGDFRLRVRVIRLWPDGKSEVDDCWARLPGAEELTDWSFLLLDERPVLVAMTKPADKLSLFGDRGLRLYELQPDRSRLGRPAFLATETASTILQRARPVLVDLDGDGREDLVLAFYKGLIGREVVLEAFPRREGTTFDDKRRTTSFGVKDPDESFLEFGKDVTGDGTGDLVVRSKDRYLVYPGLRSRNGKKLVSREALEIPSTARDESYTEMWIGMEGSVGERQVSSAPDVVVDVDGDGRAEIVTIEAGGDDEPARFTYSRVRTAP